MLKLLAIKKQNSQILVWLSLFCGNIFSFFLHETTVGPWMPHVYLVVTCGGGLVFNLDSIRKFNLANMDKHNQSCCSPVPIVSIGSIWLSYVVWDTHIHKHTEIYWHTMLTHHKEACDSRSFEVSLSWFSYVTGDTDPSLHANPFVIEPLWCPPSLHSSSLLYPDLDQPGLALFQGLHTKYGQDNVNETVMFFLTTVQQQLEKCWDQNHVCLGLNKMLFIHQSKETKEEWQTNWACLVARWGCLLPHYWK